MFLPKPINHERTSCEQQQPILAFSIGFYLYLIINQLNCTIEPHVLHESLKKAAWRSRSLHFIAIVLHHWSRIVGYIRAQIAHKTFVQRPQPIPTIEDLDRVSVHHYASAAGGGISVVVNFGLNLCHVGLRKHARYCNTMRRFS